MVMTHTNLWNHLNFGGQIIEVRVLTYCFCRLETAIRQLSIIELA